MGDIRYELVGIDSASPLLFGDLAHAPLIRFSGELYLPSADLPPPYPAVVASDTRGGVKTHRHRAYARALAEAGYVVLVHDSYAARGFGGGTHPLRYFSVSEATILADAFAALRLLAARGDVDATRIHHIGFGVGGMIALLSAFGQNRRSMEIDEATRFAGHASFYGLNALRMVDYRTTGAPAAIFYGGHDDTLNHAGLDLVVGDLRNGGSAVRLEGYDDAHHEWDRELERPGFERINLRALAGRLEPGGRLACDISGRPILTARARARWLAKAANPFGVRKVRSEETTRKALASLLEHLAGVGGEDGEGPAAGGTVLTLRAAGADRSG